MDNFSLEVKRVINAPVERVFKAWTDPAELKQWHAPEGLTVPEALADGALGGSYKITMRQPDGKDNVVAGVYKEFDPPHKLVMSWKWLEGGSAIDETRVTLLFKSLGPEQTEVTLMHDHFTDQDSMEHHKQGWSSVLDQLARFLD